MAAELTTPKLFNVLATDVTSSTRANWSKADVESIENFIDANNKLDETRADISPLIDLLNLSRYSTSQNSKGEPLGPIIEVKVRRKLAAVSADLRRRRQAQARNSTTPLLLPLSPPQAPPNGRTRLQAARADAISAGKEPRTRLPGPTPVYTPEVWRDKGKRRGSSVARAQTRTGTTPGQQLSHRIKTVAQARRHVARLEEELEAARLRLRHLEKRKAGEEEDEEESDDEDQDDDDDGALPDTLDKIAYPPISRGFEGSGDLTWWPGETAPVWHHALDSPGPSSAAAVAKEQEADEDNGSQGTGTGTGTKEHGKQNKSKNEENDTVDVRRYWIGKGSKAAALAKAFSGPRPGPDPDPDSDSDFEANQRLDELSSYLSDRYGGAGT